MAQVKSVLPTDADRPSLIPVESHAADAVLLLHDLALLESGVRLSLLFADKHVADPNASHASEAHTVIWPQVRDRVMAAGIEDLDPVLAALASATSEAEVRSAGTDVLAAVTRARGKVAADDLSIARSIHEITLEAATLISASGPTDLGDYQKAWSLLATARSEADLLVRSKDPAMAKTATQLILALDDVILFLPDPAAAGPVTLDSTALTGLADKVGSLLDEAA